MSLARFPDGALWCLVVPPASMPLWPELGQSVSSEQALQSFGVGRHDLPLWVLQASLQCSIIGSSIALLSGQKPAFRLLARAISLATGQPVPHIKPAVSVAFVVATPRVKSAQKVCSGGCPA